MTDALYRKEMRANAQKKRALSCYELDQYSSIKGGPMLQGANLTSVVRPSGHYLVFLVELLHLLHLDVSKTVKACTVAYFSTQEKKTSPSLPKKYCK